MDTDNIIECIKLSKSFASDDVHTMAIDAIDVNVKRGAFVAIEGPSGCGKSTLLSVLGLLDSPTGGVYKLSGTDVSKLNSSQKAHVRNRYVGFVFQNFNLIPDLSVYDNVKLPLKYSSSIPSSEFKERITSVLEKVGLAHRMKHKPSQLSGGQQQRVAIARALVTSPSIIFADEPTGNLDSESGENIMCLLEELNQKDGVTIIMVTHNPEQAERASQRIHLSDGKVVA